MIDLYPGALLLATLLAGHGLRKGSLSASGAIAAWLVGYVSLATPLQTCGVTLLLFYFIGSRATKVGHKIKARLETEYVMDDTPKGKYRKSFAPSSSSHKAESGGRRDAWQVLCNSVLGALCALTFRSLYAETHWQNGKRWCALHARPPITTITISRLSNPVLSLVSSTTPRILYFAMVGHFACCMGDTLASELGILAKKPPRLVLPPFRSVPAGTNGALSIQGTLGSVIGGCLIGLVASITLVYFDNVACSFQAKEIIGKSVLLGTLGGFGGSAIDSILGATLQRTWYHHNTKKVLVGRLPSSQRKGSKQWTIITGVDMLSNSAVNFISSAITSGIIAILGNFLFA